jgi:hypothetical protein
MNNKPERRWYGLRVNGRSSRKVWKGDSAVVDHGDKKIQAGCTNKERMDG